MIGANPVLDFDGTLTLLPVDWDALRNDMGVSRIGKIWTIPDADWSLVDGAEIEAARVAEPNQDVFAALERTTRFAVLTSNCSDSVRCFLERFPTTGAKCTLVVGRHELGGSKTAFEVFKGGFARCQAALPAGGEGRSATYLGNEQYELEFARRLGARAVHVAQLALERSGRLKET